MAYSAAAASALVVLASGCSDAYESYMSDACGGLRQMSDAYESEDQEALTAGETETGALHPASEEAAGDKRHRADVDDVFNAQRVLFFAAYEPPEYNDGDLVWRGQTLTDADKSAVDKGLSTCTRF